MNKDLTPLKALAKLELYATGQYDYDNEIFELSTTIEKSLKALEIIKKKLKFKFCDNTLSVEVTNKGRVITEIFCGNENEYNPLKEVLCNTIS